MKMLERVLERVGTKSNVQTVCIGFIDATNAAAGHTPA
jgi:hypothetical protein